MNKIDKKRTLHIFLKTKWFDLVKSGKTKIIYKEVKEFWMARLLKTPFEFNTFDEILFRNSYTKEAAYMIAEFKGIKTVNGDTVDFLDDDKIYYVISFGKILQSRKHGRRQPLEVKTE